VPRIEDFNLDIMDYLSKLKVLDLLSLLIQFPHIWSQVHDFSNFKEYMSKYPPIILNSRLIGRKGGSHAPFYVTMIIGDKILHNAMLDFGASSNIMPFSVMKSLNLQIIRPYGNVCRLDSRRVQVTCLIKNLTTCLFSHPDITCLMDVVVIDFPPTYGMLLLRKWSTSLGGSIHMDLSYALIPNSKGQLVILNMEPYYSEHVEELEQVEYVDNVCFLEECKLEEQMMEN
jgi:hypothetical protein